MLADITDDTSALDAQQISLNLSHCPELLRTMAEPLISWSWLKKSPYSGNQLPLCLCEYHTHCHPLSYPSPCRLRRDSRDRLILLQLRSPNDLLLGQTRRW